MSSGQDEMTKMVSDLEILINSPNKTLYRQVRAEESLFYESICLKRLVNKPEL
jgi:hypothetical protein